MKHYNIPVFVPHYGCPFSCVFCNQKEITGQNSATDLDNAEKTINEHLSTINSDDVEIAFFGGSFTAIPREIMVSYLKLGHSFIKKGKVKGIRISTRPDFIDTEILLLLKKYGVTTIELGAQSFDDEVLKKSGRGHTSLDTENSSRLIKLRGFSLGLQLMTGLCGDTEEKSVMSAKKACDLYPDCVRIYPTLVIKNTKLHDMYISGKYIPQSLEDAVNTVGRMLNIFYDKNINVIRVGLASVSDMNTRGTIVAGPDHPSIRELCEGRAYLQKLTGYISDNPCRTLIVYAPQSEFSKISGHKKCNKNHLKSAYNTNLLLKKSDKFYITSE